MGEPAFADSTAPLDDLLAAISILQAKYLAEDSLINGKAMFGPTFFMPAPALDQAVRLLVGLIAHLEGLERDGDSEIQVLFREYRANDQESSAWVPPPEVKGKDEDKEMDRLFWNRQHEIEMRMMAIPSVSAADFAAKAIVVSNQGGFMANWEKDEFWKEARRLTGTELSSERKMQ